MTMPQSLTNSHRRRCRSRMPIYAAGQTAHAAGLTTKSGLVTLFSDFVQCTISDSHILLLRLSPSLSCDGLFFGRYKKIPHLPGFNKLFLFTPYFLLSICCLTQTSSKPRLRPPHLFCNAPNQLNPTGRDSQHCILLQDWRAHPDCSKAGFCRTDQATTVVRLGRLSSADEMPNPPSLLKARGNLLDCAVIS